AGLVLDHRRMRDRRLGRPEAGGRDRADAGHLSPTGLPLSRPAPVLIRQGRDVVRPVQRHNLDRAARQLRPAKHRLLAETRVRGVRTEVAIRRSADRALRLTSGPDTYSGGLPSGEEQSCSTTAVMASEITNATG